jgi:type I restriction enzyme R subunit
MKTYTDTSEAGLESTIVKSLIDEAGYQAGNPQDYDRSHAVDLVKLTAFIQDTQPKLAERLNLGVESPTKTQFLHRLQGEIAKRGIIDVLRKGIKHGPDSITLFYGSPSANNEDAKKLFKKNIFSVTRQLQYSNDNTQLALDMAIFMNGLPIATFELKNKLTKQTVADAVQQYKNDRDPRELLFQFGRCMVHFAVDDHEVRMCTHLKGKASWFLPFNKGFNDGAGNPPNPFGLATDYLWKEILTKERLTDIIENYAQIVEEKDEKIKRKKQKQIFPRYHQLAVVRKLLADIQISGVGKRYLIQHSAGSGKSNSIAWLAHQMVGLEIDKKAVFDSIIVVTDRRILDKQIRDTIKSFSQVGSIVGHAEHSGDLRRFINEGKKIIITTVQKFPFILADIGNEHRQNKFAIIIDEAHSSQGGRTASKMNMALSADVQDSEEEKSTEDLINELMESRKMLTNASYFAFTATPKNKTLEIFGDPEPQPDGKTKHHPFHSYTMKQAIQEGFILDVLKYYTPVNSYYKLLKRVEDNPLYDVKKAQKKLKKYVESQSHPMWIKTEIIVDHFHTQVMGHRKIGGKARAMVITNSIKRAIEYYHTISDYLKEKKLPYKAIVAFSGEHQYQGQQVTEAKLNEFPSSLIRDKIVEDPYRFLIVADKFQTGYDEPLMHTMYVDKPLSGIKAVQTLSRLNRAHPQKHDTFILDFFNDSDTIQKAFSDYYKTTILSEETDPNKLHDLKSDLDAYQVYSSDQVDNLVEFYLNGKERETLDPILDACVAVYNTDLDEDGQVDFKGKAKTFVRTYGFLASLLSYTNAEWEKLSIFLNFLISKLPAPKEEDLSKGILETIDLDSYRAEVQASISISLPDEDGELEPIPTSGGGRITDVELDYLSNILKTFNDLFGNVEWKDDDKIKQVITEDIPQKVAADVAYQNAMKNSDKKNARIEHDKALGRVMVELISDHTELFKQFSDNPSFKKWLSDMVFNVTYDSEQRP